MNMLRTLKIKKLKIKKMKTLDFLNNIAVKLTFLIISHKTRKLSFFQFKKNPTQFKITTTK